MTFNNEHRIIDLLVQKSNGYVVVDYKTTIEKSHTHNKQVQNYVMDIKDIVKSDNVMGFVVYLSKDEVELVLV